MKNREKALLVLGMHRSGTSSVAGVLCKLGGTAPRTLFGAFDSNPKGHWESEEIFRLNDRILESVGSSWADWRTIPASFSSSKHAKDFRTKAIKTFKSEYQNGKLPIVKDPRICRLMPFWADVMKALDLDIHIVTPLRPPLDTARSLEARNGIPIVVGVHIWLRYVLDAEFASRGMPRTIFTWAEFLEDWQMITGRIAGDAGIDWPISPEQAAAEIDDFLTNDLRHHTSEFEQHPHVHAWATSTYDAMVGLSKEEQPELHAQLDHIRKSMDETSDLIGHFYSEYSEINRLKSTERDLKKAADSYEATIASYQALTDQYTSEIEQHWSARSELETEKKQLYQTTIILTESANNYKKSLEDYKSLTNRYGREIEEHWSVRSTLETEKNTLVQTIKSLEDGRLNDSLLITELTETKKKQDLDIELINKYIDQGIDLEENSEKETEDDLKYKLKKHEECIRSDINLSITYLKEIKQHWIERNLLEERNSETKKRLDEVAKAYEAALAEIRELTERHASEIAEHVSASRQMETEQRSLSAELEHARDRIARLEHEKASLEQRIGDLDRLLERPIMRLARRMHS